MNVDIRFKNYSHVEIECENSVLMELRNYFTFEIEGARFSPKFRYGWDGKVRLLTNEGILPIGLVGVLTKYCDNNDLSYTIDDALTPERFMTREEFDNWISSFDIYAGDTKITPHWYQADSVFEAINSNRRTLNLPTSAGKSLISALINRWYLENFEGKILVLVPTTALVQQMIDDYVDYRLFPRSMCHGIMSGTKKTTDALIVVSTWQSACKMPPTWFEQFGMVNCDECHNATAKELGGIIEKMTNCRFKFGMSGSLRDGKANILQYVGMFGEIFRPVDTRQLMDEGQVTDLKINSVFLRYPDQDVVLCKGVDYQQEISHITAHRKRNAWICKLALKLAKDKDENVLVLFRHKAHGKLLFEAIKKMYGDDAENKVHYITGDTKTSTRVKLRGDVENDSGVIIVASYGVLSTGISIKRLHHAIFAHPIKSKVTVLQSIGRTLRKHGTKDKAVLWDVVDDLCVPTKTKNAKNKYSHKNYSYKHGLDRIERYNAEKFEYKVVNISLEK